MEKDGGKLGRLSLPNRKEIHDVINRTEMGEAVSLHEIHREFLKNGSKEVANIMNMICTHTWEQRYQETGEGKIE